MDNLRKPSARPGLVVDPAARAVVDAGTTYVGRPAPFGRERVVFALPLDPGPALLQAPTFVHGPGPSSVADANEVIVGRPAVWVSRMLTARWVEDTRRLSG